MQRHYRKFMRNKPVIGLIALVSTLVFVLASTLAWFASTDARENNFKTKFKFNVDLVDEFKQPEIFELEQTVAKRVTAFNNGDIDAFVRIMAFPVASQGQTPLPLSEGVEVIYDNLNTTDWQDGGDGYFYYVGLLQPGEVAPALFTGVTLRIVGDNKADYADAYFDIIVKSEATGTNVADYRLSWWGSDATPTNPRYKVIDDGYQAALNPTEGG